MKQTARRLISAGERTRLGILGGGQLARMMAQAASRMGIELAIFAQPDDPVTQVSRNIHNGSLNHVNDLRAFFGTVDQVIFENEFIPCELLREAARDKNLIFSPGLEAMEFLQDKLNQKSALERLKIPSARSLPDRGGSPEEWFERVLDAFPRGAVLKWAQMGYDGKGTFFLSSRKDFEKALVFRNEAELRRLPLYAEERIEFKRELAIVACASTQGEFTCYPLTISEQESGVCVRVTGPATAFGVPARLEKEARSHAERLSNSLGLTGCFAIEFFETKEGRLLVNEIAPRVHNTGHFSLDASETDQFENHLRAVLGMPLGSTDSGSVFYMRNLLGPSGLEARTRCTSVPPLGRSTHLHWYGKTEVARGRKMGHLNGMADSKAKLKPVARELEASAALWEKEVLGKRPGRRREGN